MAGRTHSQKNYRFGFNGQERDDDFNGNYAYKYRLQDSRLGRFLSVDPLAYKYPLYTPYQFAANQPIQDVDIEGLELIGDMNGFIIPNTPAEVDPAYWSFISPNTGTERGHTYRWSDRYGNMLAYDAKDDGWHVYDPYGNRLGSDGNFAGEDNALGFRIYDKSYKAKGLPGNGHFYGGQQTKIVLSQTAFNNSYQLAPWRVYMKPVDVKGKTFTWNKVKSGGNKHANKLNTTNKAARFLGYLSVANDLLAVIINSPNSPVYTFHNPGDGKENRAYPTNLLDGFPYYEWRMKGGLREVEYFYDYKLDKNGTWRGSNSTGVIEHYDKNGEKVILN